MIQHLLTLSVITLVTSLPLVAAETAATADAESKTNRWVDSLPDVIKNGKINVNARARWEHANQDAFGGSSNPEESNAFTVRTRLGFTTGSLYDFKAMMEVEDVSIIGSENNYNQAGINPGASDRTVIADPEGTELNRAWLSYDRFDTTVKYGRQRIILDNARFVGNVGWRQNEQTFDGITIKNTGLLPDTTLFYSFLHNVNRVFGDDHPLGDFDSENHLVNGSWSGWKYGTVTAYSYLLALRNFSSDSSATYGASFVGSAPICEDLDLKATYRAEYAYQTDYRNNATDYDADYYHLNLGGVYKRFNAGAGYEVLGSDDKVKGFTTPLATLHGFNGWADAFLDTPADGLEDIYAWVGVLLPGDVPLKAFYHDFSAEDGGNDYGYEIDIVASRKFGKHFGLLAKYAMYEDGDDGRASRDKFWLQAEFNY